jgi:nucleoid-associated protein YgaU
MATKWEQVKKFDPKKMGSVKGYCLYNVRLGYGLQSKYPSAKADMEANKKAGTFHSMKDLPKNVAVPVYADTSSPYEHIMVCDKGTYYSDGKKLASGAGWKFFGWGEMCEGVRVVKKIKTTEEPTASTGKTISYAVRKGDTLSSIASKYGTTWQKIYEDNKNTIGSNPNLIRPGQRLTIKV